MLRKWGLCFITIIPPQEVTRFDKKRLPPLRNGDYDYSQQVFGAWCGISDAIAVTDVLAASRALNYACAESGADIYWKITSTVTVARFTWQKLFLF